MQRMVQVLEHYPQLRVSFIHLLVDTVSLFGGDATAALPVIAKILLDKSTEHPFIQRAAIRYNDVRRETIRSEGVREKGKRSQVRKEN